MQPRTLLLLCGLAFLAAVAQAAPPKPDFTNLPAYIRALQASHDPQAVAIRQQIADGPAALTRERAAAQAAGIPLDPTQLRQPLPPPNQNAAPLYEKWTALRRHQMVLPPYADSLNAAYAYTPEQLAQVQKVFDDHAALIHMLHQAAKRPKCVYQLPWSRNFTQDAWVVTMQFPHLAAMREGVRELKTESYLMASQGHDTEAVTDQALGFQIAKQAMSGRGLNPYFVGDAVEAITLSGLKDILLMAGPNTVLDRQVQQTIAADRPHFRVSNVLRADVPMSYSALNAIHAAIHADVGSGLAEIMGASETPAQKPAPLSPTDKRFAEDLLDAAEAFYLHQMRRLIAAANLSPMKRRMAFRRILSGPSANNPVQAYSNRFLYYGKLPEHEDQRVAQEETVVAAAAVLAAKAHTGAFPRTLPGGFFDPFSGKRLGYRREGSNGFVIYSVGTGGKFDGGKPGEYQFNPFQVFFRYPGPAPVPVPKNMLM